MLYCVGGMQLLEKKEPIYTVVKSLHVGVERSPTFGDNPVDVLHGILDVAGLAVHAVLVVDHEFVVHILVDACRTVPALGSVVHCIQLGASVPSVALTHVADEVDYRAG